MPISLKLTTQAVLMTTFPFTSLQNAVNEYPCFQIALNKVFVNYIITVVFNRFLT